MLGRSESMVTPNPVECLLTSLAPSHINENIINSFGEVSVE